jgi:uncharacterized protein DUF4339
LLLPDLVRIYISRDGQIYGPYTPEELREHLATGHASLDDLSRHEGLTEWVPLSAIIGTAMGTAAPKANSDSLVQLPSEPEPFYHHVSALKFSLLSLCSCGLYELFWFYRNWRFVRERDVSNISPFWRAVFSPFWVYSLCRDVARAGGNIHSLEAWLITIGFLVLGALWRLPDPYWLVSLFSFVPLIHVVLEIDLINRRRQAKAAYYRTFTLKHIALCVTGTLFLAFGILTSFNILPSTQVISGDRLSHRQRTFLRDNRIVTDSEEIHYFYSAGRLSIATDGNLVTNQRVISYYRDPSIDQLVVESARYSEIRDVRVNHSQSFLDDTEIQVVMPDKQFSLYVSAEEKCDRLFANKLMELWNAKRKAEK